MKKLFLSGIGILLHLLFILPFAHSQSLTLDYSTYLGDSYGALGIAVDSTGAAYITGSTRSTSFPTLNPYQSSFGGGSWDAFVSKLGPSGSYLIYSMYLGGSGDEDGRDISIEAGEAYLCGYTTSDDFPTENSYQPGRKGGYDCFVSKVSSSGSTIIFSTYMGGDGSEFGYGVSVNGGEVYLAGYTESNNFPTENPYQQTLEGGKDAFVSKLSSSGSLLLYSTYLGGAGDERSYDIFLENDATYLTGYTESENFPTNNPFQAEHAGIEDAFVSKLSSSGSVLLFSTYYGGDSGDRGYGISVENGDVYLTGSTFSDNFPTKNPYQPGRSGGDVFISKLSSSGSLLYYSTYLGGSLSYDSGRSIDVEAGEACVGGYTKSSDFPVLNPYQSSNDGYDGFVTRVASSGSYLIYSTYLGGSGTDRIFGIDVRAGAVYVAGRTNSPDFPTENPYQAGYAGDYNPFVSKLILYTPTPTPIGYKTPTPPPTTSPTPSVTPSPTTTPSPSATAPTTTPTPYAYKTPWSTPTPVNYICRLHLDYSTYIGGTAEDYGHDIAVDSNHCAYVTGHTSSSNFPLKGAYQLSISGGYEAFLTKLSSSGSSLHFSTYIGGSGEDYGMGIYVTSELNAYITGHTTSPDFPTLNSYQTSCAGNKDIFITKLASSGSGLLFSTYMGGSGQDTGNAIIACAGSKAFITGSSTSGDFPMRNPYQSSLGGSSDGVVCCLTSSGSSLVFSSFIGGADGDSGNDISLDSSNNTYIVGTTSSADFPVAYAYDPNGPSAGYSDAFITKISSSGSFLLYSTYLGRRGLSSGNGIDVDTAGYAYVTGGTNSSNFPLVNAYQTSHGLGWIAYVTRFSSSGSALVFSTYLGGTYSSNQGNDISVLSDGRAYVTGYTSSSAFPILSSAQSSLAGDFDAFITAFGSTGSSLHYSSYLGGGGEDRGQAISPGPDGAMYITGYTSSTDFPLENSYQELRAGGTDVFVSKLRLDCYLTTPTPIGYITPTPTPTPVGYKTPEPSPTVTPSPSPTATPTPYGYKTPSPSPTSVSPIYVPDDFATIQESINASFDGYTIIVRDGTYTGEGNRDIDFLGKAITLRSENGPVLTILNGQGNRLFYFHSGETSSSVLDGFTISGGGLFRENGAGIYIENSSPIIRNCIISGNSISGGSGKYGIRLYGGGIYFSNSFTTILDCTISNNSIVGSEAEVYNHGAGGTATGGGIYCSEGAVTISHCSIYSNSARGGIGGTYYGSGGFGSGGGIYGPATVTHSIIYNNLAKGGDACYGAWGYGGGISKATEVLNCLIYNNSAQRGIQTGYGGHSGAAYGAGIYDSPVITNCTIYNNSAQSAGGGTSGSPTITNSIIWSNTPDQINGASSTINYSAIEGGWSGTWNIDSDPGFVSATDFHLTVNSPCIDSGDNSVVDWGKDLDNHTRIWNGSGVETTIVDMGVYEYGAPLTTPIPTPTIYGFKTPTPFVQPSPSPSPIPFSYQKIEYSTYLGGSGDDRAYDIAQGSDFCAYITGCTSSTDFPTSNSYQLNQNMQDTFVSKLSSSGSSLIYSTYMGGSAWDYAYGIAIDSLGYAYVVGMTNSKDFPILNAYQSTNYATMRTACVFKLSSSGSVLIYSTYLGGGYNDEGLEIAVDSANCAYITGRSSSTDFPLVNPYQGHTTGFDAFVTKFSSSGSILLFSTYLGGWGGYDESGVDIAVDSLLCAYLTGYTTADNFPTVNSYQSGGFTSFFSQDAFVTKFASSGSYLLYSTYLGGSSPDVGYGIIVDTKGYAYISGYTESSNFPTFEAFQSSSAGGRDIFVTKFSSSGTHLVYSTYLGGSETDTAWDIALDSTHQLNIAGETNSFDFPLVPSGQPPGGVVVSKFHPSGSSLIYSLRLGVANVRGISIDSTDCIYLTGYTSSLYFPIKNAYQIYCAGSNDIFVSKLNLSISSPTPYGYQTPPPTPTATPTLMPSPTATSSSTPSSSPTINPTATPSLTPFATLTPSSTPIYMIIAGNDYDGDGTADMAVWNLDSGKWLINISGGGTPLIFYYGIADDIPVPGDYDGDGSTDAGIFRSASGLWAIRGLSRLYFGADGDIPVPGDYDGDGTVDPGIFRQASSLWAIRGISRCYFGGSDDLSIPGDYGGDGTDRIGIFRPFSGLWAVLGITRSYFGREGDYPVPAGYRGVGDEIGIFRPITGLWAIRAVSHLYFGTAGDIPQPADFSGNGLPFITIYRPTTGLWAIRGHTRAYWGGPSYIPLTQ